MSIVNFAANGVRTQYIYSKVPSLDTDDAKAAAGYSRVSTSDASDVGALLGSLSTGAAATNGAETEMNKLEKVEEKEEQELEMQVWIQEAMAQVQALQQYGVITIILSGFAFTGFVSLNHSQIKDDLNYKIANVHVGGGIVFSLALSMALCIACGLYATIIFTLCSIYGAVAVSHGDQDGFKEFMKRTGPHRVWAFRGFKGALVSMASAIVLLILTKIPFFAAIAVIIPSCAIAFCAAFQGTSVMAIAKEEFEHSALATYQKKGIGKSEDDEDEDGLSEYISEYEGI